MANGDGEYIPGFIADDTIICQGQTIERVAVGEEGERTSLHTAIKLIGTKEDEDGEFEAPRQVNHGRRLKGHIRGLSAEERIRYLWNSEIASRSSAEGILKVYEHHSE